MAQDAIFYPDPWPQQGPRKIAPLTLIYGDQPPRKAALALSALLCIQAWNPPDPAPQQRRLNIAPLTLTYGSKPPIQGALPAVDQQITRMAWETIPQPTQKRVQIAPLTLVYGNQPPIQGPMPPAELAIVRGQWEVAWTAQSEPPSAAWNVAAAAVARVPFARSWLPIVRSSWDITWGAQSEAPSAAWNVAVVVNTPPPLQTGWMQTVLQSWVPAPPVPWQMPPLQVVDNTPPTPPVAVATLGAPDRLPMRRFSAEINGKFYYFDSLDELSTVLNSFKAKQKKKIAKLVTKRVIEVQLPYVEPPVHVPMWAVKEIERTNASLEAYYWAQLQKLLDNDEDDAIVALYG